MDIGRRTEAADGDSATLPLVVVALASCVAGIFNGYAQDDVSIIRDNPLMHDTTAWGRIFTTPYWPPPFPPDLYRPIASLLLALQSALGGGAPLIFRIVSYLLYALLSVAVLRLASRLTPPRVAFGIAALFAAHPVHVESVALAVNQGELIVALLGTLMVIRYIDRRRAGELRSRDWAQLIALYLVASLTKETGLVLPGLLAASELLIEDGRMRFRAHSLWRGYATLAAAGALVILVRTAVLGGLVGSFTAEALAGATVGGRALTMLQVVPHWIRLLVWPAHLRADYSPGELVASTELGGMEALGLALVVAWIASIWMSRRRTPLVAFGLVWMGVALLPVSNVLVPTGILMAERTLLLPSIGFLIAVAGAALHLARRWPATFTTRRRALIALCDVLIVAGIARSTLRERVWRDEPHLWLASVRDAPRSWRVQYAYGDMLFHLGYPKEGFLAYGRAIRWAPEPWRLRTDLSRRLRDTGDDSRALDQLHASLAVHPDQADAWVELGAALLGLGRYGEARRLSDSLETTRFRSPVISRLGQLADSALAVRAAPGSLRLRVRTEVGRGRSGTTRE